MFDLNQGIDKEIKIGNPRILIYGTPKIGKTTFAAEAPDPIILDFENGSKHLDVHRIQRSKMPTFTAVMDVLKALYTQDHNYKTIVIDSIDWLERLIFEDICKEYSANSISDPKVKALGYGAGYDLSTARLAEFTKALDHLIEKRNMMPILIGHPQIKVNPNPEHEGYEAYNLKLYKKNEALFREWADCILFARQKVHVVTSEGTGFKKSVNKGKSGERIISTGENAAYLAGNRYNLPNELPLSYKAFWEAFCKSTGYGAQPKITPKPPKPPKVNMNLTMGIPVVAYNKINGSNITNDFLDI